MSSVGWEGEAKGDAWREKTPNAAPGLHPGEEGDQPLRPNTRLILLIGTVGSEQARRLLANALAVVVGEATPESLPFEPTEIEPEDDSGGVFQVGDLRIGVKDHTVTRGDEPVRVSERELQILVVLGRAPGVAVSFQELAQKAWGNDYGDYHQYVRAAVGRLRKKLRDADVNVRIEAAPGYGYRVTAGPSNASSSL